MGSFALKAAAWLRRRAENVLACLLGAMFVAFIAQIVLRYFFALPTGSMYELTVVAWLWMVLWGSAFVLKESDEIRFDLLYWSVNRHVRRAMAIASGVALIVLYAASFPATVKYVSFMKVERTDYLHIRLDWLYSIYAIFAFAVIVRYAWILWRLLRGRDPEAPQSLDVSSGL
ncbi:MAG TPA: TRAP transporter small permease subunit [Burkholderiales bacterium]|nr:TRAP transporter small permease subunit [Burkholderiales bacterium]